MYNKVEEEFIKRVMEYHTKNNEIIKEKMKGE